MSIKLPEFFIISDNTFISNRYPQCSLKFEGGEGRTCKKCGRSSFRIPEGGNPYITVQEGRQWPDILGSTGSAGSPILSQRVIEALINECTLDWTYEEVDIHLIGDNPLERIPPPKYYYTLVTPGVAIDLDKSDIPRPLCEECFYIDNVFGLSDSKKYAIKPSTWNGNDIFRIKNWETSPRYCTQKVFQLAKRHKWTNFSFISGEPDVVARLAGRAEFKYK